MSFFLTGITLKLRLLIKNGGFSDGKRMFRNKYSIF